MEKHNLEVDILGTSFTIQAAEDPLYLKQLVGYVERAVRQIQERSRSYEPIKIALLAALNVADELFRCRSARGVEAPADSEEIERITERLIETIDRSLTDN